MKDLMRIDDLHRPVTAAEYMTLVSKTAISVELLYRTTEPRAADLIMHTLLTGMASRLKKDLGEFVNAVRNVSRGIKEMGFYQSAEFNQLVQDTLTNGEPNEEAAAAFYEYVATEAPLVSQHLPPPGTLFN